MLYEVITNADLRVMPTRRPFFFDPSQAGEGYPFDYFQNSAVWVGTPLRVTHRSADGAWYLVEAGYAYGWLSADALAWTDSDFNADYQTGRYAAIVITSYSIHYTKLYDLTALGVTLCGAGTT